LLVATLGLGSGGCFTARKQLVLPPAPQVAAKPAPLPEPQFETPPEIDTPLPPIDIPAFTLAMPPAPETPTPKPVTVRRPTTTPVTPTPTTPVPTTPEAEQPPPVPVPTTPQLSEILTDDRRRQYEADFLASVTTAQTAVKRASGRKLNAMQKQTVQRINTFLQQAEESKSKDLVTAVQLAHRANVLGQDLLKSLP
jgi:hypothetical protein